MKQAKDLQKALSEQFAKKGNQSSWRKGNEIVVYTRVSSYEQAKYNTSLSTQRRDCELVANSRNLVIKAHFGGTYESAKTDERKEFKRMMEYVKKNPLISAILVYSYDRFSRSDEGLLLVRQLAKIGVRVLSVFQDIDVTTASGKLQQDIFMAFGNYDNELRKDKTIKGMIDNLRQGYWVAAAPFGYTNLHRKEKARNHRYVINEEGELLKLGFKWKAEGKMNNLEIVRKLQELGSKIEYKSFARIISNPFYCGYVTHSLIPEEMYKGHHPALVSESLFFKANSENSLNPHKGISKKSKNEAIPLKSFAKDEISQSPLTGYIQKGIYYYKTRAKGTNVNVRAEALNQLFTEKIRQLEFKDEFLSKLRELLTKLISEKLADQLKNQQQVKKQITELQQKADKLELRYVEGEIDRTLFEKYRDLYHQQMADLKQQAEQSSMNSSNLEKLINRGLQIAQNAGQLWLSSDYDDKQRLQHLIYPEGIRYHKQTHTVRTPRINTLFGSIAELVRVSAENKKGRLSKNDLHSHLVAPTGIEPVSKV